MESVCLSFNTRLCLIIGMIAPNMDFTETKSLMTEMGPEVVNRDKITVSFVCKPTSTRLDIVSKL